MSINVPFIWDLIIRTDSYRFVLQYSSVTQPKISTLRALTTCWTPIHSVEHVD